jgi:hypothetical protein
MGLRNWWNSLRRKMVEAPQREFNCYLWHFELVSTMEAEIAHATNPLDYLKAKGAI